MTIKKIKEVAEGLDIVVNQDRDIITCISLPDKLDVGFVDMINAFYTVIDKDNHSIVFKL